MSIDAFNSALTAVLAEEGGYVNHPSDPGGETNYGVTKATAISAGYHGDMRSIPMDVVRRIYRSRYWDAVRGDEVSSINAELAGQLFDFAVNAGPKTAQLALQQAMNLINEGGTRWPDIPVDGVIGPITLRHLGRIPAAWHRDLVLAYRAYRARRYIEIAEAKPTSEVFARGWLRRAFRGVKT